MDRRRGRDGAAGADAVGISRTLPLSATPYEATLEVSYDDGGSTVVSTAWSYDATANAVVLDAWPEVGSTWTVTYTPL